MKINKKELNNIISISRALNKLNKGADFANYSVMDICKTSNVSTATFYRHYKNLSGYFISNEDRILIDLTHILNKYKDISATVFYRNILIYIYDEHMFLNSTIDIHNNAVFYRIFDLMKPFVVARWASISENKINIVYGYFASMAIEEIMRWRKEKYSINMIEYHSQNLIKIEQMVPRFFVSLV